MGRKIIAGLMVLATSIASGCSNPPKERHPDAEPVPAARGAEVKKPKKCTFAIDAIIEEVDIAANTITVRSTIHVIPPHDHVGGKVSMTGTTGSNKEKTTKFLRLPVMPEAQLKSKNLKVGHHAIVEVEMLRHGALVVVGIDEFTGVERIGIDWLDAPGTKEGK